MSKIYNGALELVGNTPLVEVRRIRIRGKNPCETGIF